MKNSSYDRKSSVQIDDQEKTIKIEGQRIGHDTDAAISEALASQSHNHTWIQRGNYLHCDGAGTGFAHGIAIHVDDRYMGDDSTGAPILKRLDVDKLK